MRKQLLSYRRCRTLLLMVSLGGITACGASHAGPALPGGAASEPVTAFVDVSVIPMDSERVLTNQTVLVQGGQITALGPIGQITVPANAVRIDGHGKFLMPGLADMHTHLQFEDSVGDARNLLGLVVQGVTTIRNMDFVSHTSAFYDQIKKGGGALEDGRLLRLRARAASGALLSPRIYTSGPWPGTTAGRPVDAAVAIPAYKAAGYDFVKIHDEDLETFDSVAAAARRVGIPVVGHLPKGGSIEQGLAAGYRSIEHLDGYPSVAVLNIIKTMKDAGIKPDALLDTLPTLPAFRAIVAATKRSGTWICPTMAISELVAQTNGCPQGVLNIQSAFGGAKGCIRFRREVVRALQDAGVGLLLGTDESDGQGELFRILAFMGNKHPHPLTVQWELEALARSGLTPYQALVTGTRNVALYFGTLQESGTVTVGKRADLVLLNGNPLTDIQHVEEIAGVMLNGRWLARADLDQRVAAVATPEAK